MKQAHINFQIFVQTNLLIIADPEKVFRSRMVYPEINLECKRVGNQTAGDWFWLDEGKLVQTLPPCQVIHFVEIKQKIKAEFTYYICLDC